MEIIDQQITLKRVFLHHKNISDQKIEYICSKDLSNVEDIWLGNNGITHKGIYHFQNAEWKNLTLLVLCNNQIGSKGCKYISRPNFQKLAWINLTKNQIGSEGALHLSKANWNLLTMAYFSFNLIGDGAHYLLAVNWPSLNILSLTSNKIYDREILKFFMMNLSFESLELQSNLQGKQRPKYLKLMKDKYNIKKCSF